MVSKRFTEEFKLEAIKQITERHYTVAEVSARLGVSTHSLYAWVKKYDQPETVRVAAEDQQAMIKRLPVSYTHLISSCGYVYQGR